MSFETEHGPDLFADFFQGMNDQTNDDMFYDGTDAAVWRDVRDRFDLAAGTDTTPIFETWSIPLE